MNVKQLHRLYRAKILRFLSIFHLLFKTLPLYYFIVMVNDNSFGIALMASEKIKITAGSSKEQLPKNVDTLQQMVLTLLGEIDDLSGQLHYLKRQLFGKKSEKLDPNQRLLFEQLYEETKTKIEQQQQKSETPRQKNNKKNENHNGRNPLPSDLPRETIEIEPSQQDKSCPVCKNQKQCIGSEVTEKLEYIPASFYVKKYVRNKYACKACQSNISIAPLPAMAIDKGIAGEGLLAHIITSKYADHGVRRKVVYKMRDGPSQPECRFWLQTTVSCVG